MCWSWLHKHQQDYGVALQNAVQALKTKYSCSLSHNTLDFTWDMCCMRGQKNDCRIVQKASPETEAQNAGGSR